ncbi:histidine phosphatase family protein [Rhizobium alvei]|uniref:Histidine phosphatase family protein n=1 Tax=Rhizobium alvei TaxID=1132659 RepID=A0ABT8YQP1_9HYPH|nr:histidine phosphatase family protein [Rhizobium alvei]MDO6965604.1 histidine phosphatase family protein [Rhizobium alvei]
MFGFYVTHPQVMIDPSVPVPRWSLSPLGKARAEAAAKMPWVAKLGRIVASEETKAIETAEIMARRAGLSVEILPHSGENDRSATGFLVPAEFEKAADRFFAYPSDSFRGWERACDAQARIVGAVDRLLSNHDPDIPIAIVGHGGVGTLLKCHLGGVPIARDRDQPAGGGNLYAFRLADRSLACDWKPFDEWEGPEKWMPKTV